MAEAAKRREKKMIKVAALIWIMLGTTLAGIAVTAVVATPQLAEQSAKLIPIWAAVGFLIAMPISLMIAKKIAAAR